MEIQQLCLDAFRLTRQRVEDMARITRDEGDNNRPGFVYAGDCYIFDETEADSPKYSLVIGRDSFESRELESLEKTLYEEWYLRECASQSGADMTHTDGEIAGNVESATLDSFSFTLPNAMQRLQLAEQFYIELNDSVEVLSDIVEQHGARTLSDLFHLHASIINNGFIDAWPESAVMEVVSQLPSAASWLEYASVYDENGLQKESIFSRLQAQVLMANEDSQSPGM